MEDGNRLQRDGATARAAGVSMFSNPLYRSDRMPAATGEAVSEWEASAEAWRIGWEMEDMIRGDCAVFRFT